MLPTRKKEINASILSVSIDDLVDILEEKPGAVMVIMVTRTEPRMNKKHRVTKEPCPYPKGVYKLAARTAVLGANYETKVNRNWFRDAVSKAEQRGVDTTSEEDFRKVVDDIPVFKAEALWNGYGRHVSRFTVENTKTGERYFYFLPSTERGSNAVATVMSDEWHDAETDRIIDGTELEDLKAGFLPPISVAESGQTWRTVKLSNVVRLFHGGIQYEVSHHKVKVRV